MILVTGATGNVGRRVAAALTKAGANIRTTSRTSGDIPADLSNPSTLTPALEKIDTVFLIWPGPTTPGIEDAIDTITKTARKIVYLSATSADQGFWGTVEKTIEATNADWVFLRPGGFATNTLGWANMIRDEGAVRWAYGQAARSLIHENDIADVAVRALLADDLDGRRPILTGPANVTQEEQVRLIGDAIGRPLTWIEEPSGIFRQRLLAEWRNEAFVDASISYWASLVGRGEPVTETVAEITGHPARTFATWAADHVADFR